MKVGVWGASGYAGAELLRICASHPDLEVVVAGAETYAGTQVAGLYPSLAACYPELSFSDMDPQAADGLDVLFMCLPHGVSQTLVGELRGRAGAIVDLAADFRLSDPAVYSRWYGGAHQAPELLAEAAYGLPELNRDQVAEADLVAVAGCYPTAAGLALAPFVQAGLIRPEGVIVDAASGVSGRGRSPSPSAHFPAANEDFCAYGLLNHRHTPEIEQVTGCQVLFTPHLAPMTRGILATCYARPASAVSTREMMDLLRSAYAHEPFVTVVEAPPSTKATTGSNSAHLTVRVDERTGWLVVLCALDNLVKGAAGQAVQCANLVLGLAETTGLAAAGVYP
jgi:N-acetyl-gamma-glutamyl-phosphate reductase